MTSFSRILRSAISWPYYFIDYSNQSHFSWYDLGPHYLLVIDVKLPNSTAVPFSYVVKFTSELKSPSFQVSRVLLNSGAMFFVQIWDS
ncbi:hypothetical protein AHAS_Ahas08G0056600 [Arachis hypogaea]